MARNTDPDSIQVLARAASVLRIVAAQPGGIGLSDIARQTGLARSTIQRIAKSLEDESFLDALPGRAGYTLGAGLHALLGRSAVNAAALAEPFLKELAAAVAETVDLSVLKGSRALFVSHIAGSHRLSALSVVGTQFPLHSTANGKALLACLTPQQREILLPHDLTKDTPNTVIDRKAILDNIDQIARSGISYDIEEHTEGVCAIGTAFLGAVGQPYAVSIPVPRQRFFEKQAELKAPLLACRNRIAEIAGGRIVSEA